MVNSRIISFERLDGKTAYNPTVPFDYANTKYKGVRVESIDSEFDSRTLFAKKRHGDLWEIDHSIPSLPLQDPSQVTIGSTMYILGVKVFQDGFGTKWRQEIYRGNSLHDLGYLCSGPPGMKDIRFVDLKDRVGVFTRPQGEIGGKGRIGYLEVGTIDELEHFTTTDWNGGPLIDNLFTSDQWGGVNQALRLTDNQIGVIGHIAHETINDERQLEKHYYAMSFVFNSVRRDFNRFKILAQRSDFPQSSSKRSPELDDVIFPAGIDNQSNLYCGLSDFCVGKKKIQKPF